LGNLAFHALGSLLHEFFLVVWIAQCTDLHAVLQWIVKTHRSVSFT